MSQVSQVKRLMLAVLNQDNLGGSHGGLSVED